MGGMNGMGGMSRFGGYGGSYGGYGSRYGGYGGSYGGYGSRYGGYGGGYGGRYGGFDDGYGPQMQPEGWYGSFQRFLNGFGSFSRVLDATSYSMQDSFHTIFQFARTYGELRNTVGYGMKAITLFAFIQVAWRKLKNYVMGPDNESAWNNGVDSIQPQKKASGLSWSQIAIIMGLMVYVLPWVWKKLRQFLGYTSNAEKNKFVALYDFNAETQDEVSFR